MYFECYYCNYKYMIVYLKYLEYFNGKKKKFLFLEMFYRCKNRV